MSGAQHREGQVEQPLHAAVRLDGVVLGDGFGAALVAGAAALLLGAVFVALRAPGRAESRKNAGIDAPLAAEAA